MPTPIQIVFIFQLIDLQFVTYIIDNLAMRKIFYITYMAHNKGNTIDNQRLLTRIIYSDLLIAT